MYKLIEAQIKRVVENGSKALFDYCRRNKIHFVVTGVSGGLDSAVTLGFAERTCKLAKIKNFPLTSVGLIMPCHSDAQAQELGLKAIEKFNTEKFELNLCDAFDSMVNLFYGFNSELKNLAEKKGAKDIIEEWDWSEKIAFGNIKARLRMMCGTYHAARMLKGMVLSTDNLSELWMAFWTLHGDVGDFGIIQKIMKGLELYDIARYLKVPQEIINAKPDDGLGISGGDADQLGAEYVDIDAIMAELIRKRFRINGSLKQLKNLPAIKGIPSEIVYLIAKRCLAGAFKRKGTVVLSRKRLGLPEIRNIKLKGR